MRTIQFWWRTIINSSHENPPRFVEFMMIIFATISLIIWIIKDDWPYLVLFLGYLVGINASIWVQGAIAPMPPSWWLRTNLMLLLAILLFIVCVTLIGLQIL
jgi:hypothetical protein